MGKFTSQTFTGGHYYNACKDFTYNNFTYNDFTYNDNDYDTYYGLHYL